MKKPVVDIDTENVSEMWKHEYQAKHYSYKRSPRGDLEIIASDSLINLKKEVKNRGWSLAWITCKSGSLSYGQNCVDEYPYSPRY